jgi:DNA-binding NtrC family response regulator
MSRPVILLVDDESWVVDGISRVLWDEDYEILSASCADEAWSIMKQRAVDVIVSDERMPGRQGSELLGDVRREYPCTIRLLLTGHATIEAAARAINDGEIFRFLLKPCNPEELKKAIALALEERADKLEAARVLKPIHESRDAMKVLEREHPGISTLAQTEDGAIIVDVEDVNISEITDDIKSMFDRVRASS